MKRSEVALLMVEDLEPDEREELWDKGVIMDDWDYMLIGPPDIVREVQKVGMNWETGSMEKVNIFEPVSWTFERLLTGCCHNRWYRVEFRGEQVAIGVAYHS